MSAWPETMKVGPIGEWPEVLTANRQVSKFSATLSDTLTLLDREIYHLVDTKAQQESAELLIAIPPGAFRVDGRPYANAKAEHPGVIFSIDSPYGHLSYPCDTFTTWQDNLRAIALALEATATPAGFTTASDAHAWLIELVGATDLPGVPQPALVLRKAQRITHPDMGGDLATFQRVSLAEAKLREAGLL
jgi:hypothetical protein